MSWCCLCSHRSQAQNDQISPTAASTTSVSNGVSTVVPFTPPTSPRVVPAKLPALVRVQSERTPTPESLTPGQVARIAQINARNAQAIKKDSSPAT